MGVNSGSYHTRCQFCGGPMGPEQHMCAGWEAYFNSANQVQRPPENKDYDVETTATVMPDTPLIGNRRWARLRRWLNATD